MNDCLFCSIAANHDKLIWENDVAAAFRDIHPKAPVHVLVVPKAHVPMLDELHDTTLGGQLLEAIQAVAAQEGIKGAYRVRVNNGRTAGQLIDHLHFHVTGGTPIAESDDEG